MPHPSAKQALMPSVLDRLIDPHSQGTAERPWYGVAEVIHAVERDLSDLLNTRQTHQGLCDDLPEVSRSLVAYGLPDLGSLEAATEKQREEIGRDIEELVRRFEPRLKDVRAVLADPGDNRRRTVHFRIEARLNVEPAPDVAFDATLQLPSGEYTVQATA